MPNLPRIHERTLIVQGAEAEIGSAVLKLAEAHGLTGAELLTVLNRIAATTLKYMIRHERHGDGSLPGDLAPDSEDPNAVIPRWGLPREHVSCPGCGLVYGSRNGTVCGHCEECNECCSCAPQDQRLMEPDEFVEKHC